MNTFPTILYILAPPWPYSMYETVLLVLQYKPNEFGVCTLYTYKYKWYIIDFTPFLQHLDSTILSYQPYPSYSSAPVHVLINCSTGVLCSLSVKC
jgi:hypothetical protein